MEVDNAENKMQSIKRKQKYKKLMDIGGDLSKKIENVDSLDCFNAILEIAQTCSDIPTLISKGKGEASEYVMDAQVC
jgi:hypothetical protein